MPSGYVLLRSGSCFKYTMSRTMSRWYVLLRSGSSVQCTVPTMLGWHLLLRSWSCFECRVPRLSTGHLHKRSGSNQPNQLQVPGELCGEFVGKLVGVRYHHRPANSAAGRVTVPRRRWHTMPSASGKTVPGGLCVHLGTIARCLHPPQRRQDPQSSGSPTTSQRWETLPGAGTRNVLHCGLRIHFQCHVVLL